MRAFLFLLLIITNMAIAEEAPKVFWESWPQVHLTADSTPIDTISASVKWHLDCSAETGELIGKIGSAAPGQGGTTILLDGQLTRVLVISSEGLIIRSFGQPGDGPGDLPGAYRAFELSDGRIGVCNGAPPLTFMFGGMGEIALFNKIAEPVGEWLGIGDPGTMPMSTIRELRCSGDKILTAGDGIVHGESGLTRIQELSEINSLTGERKVLFSIEYVDKLDAKKMHEEDYFDAFAYGRCDISSSGKVAFAPDRDKWLVVIHGEETAGRVLRRNWKPVKRTAEQILDVQKKFGGPETCEVLENHPAIGRLRWRTNGNLWVEPIGLELQEEEIAIFDECDQSGSFIRRVAVKWNGHKSGDVPIFLENGQLVILRGFESGKSEKTSSETGGEVFLLELGV